MGVRAGRGDACETFAFRAWPQARSLLALNAERNLFILLALLQCDKNPARTSAQQGPPGGGGQPPESLAKDPALRL